MIHPAVGPGAHRPTASVVRSPAAASIAEARPPEHRKESPMRALASVSPIGGPSTAELVAAGIENDIREGLIAPGALVDLAEVAEQRRVKLAPLRLHLGAAERDGLVTLRGNVATVAQLDLAEVRGIYRLLRTIETDLMTRASRLISPAELDRLEAEIGGTITRSGDHDTSARAVIDLFTRLCLPAASRPELLTYTDTRLALSRYLRLGFRAIEAGDPRVTSRRREDDDRNGLCRELVTAFRNEQAGAIANAVQEFRRRGQQVAEMAFELYPARPGLRAL
jgi:DNA-binding GntR family transcriptional regulator